MIDRSLCRSTVAKTAKARVARLLSKADEVWKGARYSKRAQKVEKESSSELSRCRSLGVRGRKSPKKSLRSNCPFELSTMFTRESTKGQSPARSSRGDMELPRCLRFVRMLPISDRRCDNLRGYRLESGLNGNKSDVASSSSKRTCESPFSESPRGRRRRQSSSQQPQLVFVRRLCSNLDRNAPYHAGT